MPETNEPETTANSDLHAETPPGEDSSARPLLGPGSPRLEERLRQLDAWDTEWVRPDAKYPRLLILSEILSTVVWTVLLSIPLVFVSLGWWNWPWLWLAILLPVASVADGIVEMILVPRRARSRGYAERDDDLLVRSGVLWHTVNVIPYGRLQTVEVSVGPLERMFGLASVELHTASSTTDAKIKGISARDAARLREELSQRCDDRLAGL